MRNRLRAELDDPLLVRVGPKLVRTALAEKLQPELAVALEAVKRVLDARVEFDPKRAVRRFTVFAADYAQAVVIPALLRRLRPRRPNCG
jgi:LysR family transcriptional regulator, nod-box dependent transcriptional activator